jgi:hypothetical protein
MRRKEDFNRKESGSLQRRGEERRGEKRGEKRKGEERGEEKMREEERRGEERREEEKRREEERRGEERREEKRRREEKYNLLQPEGERLTMIVVAVEGGKVQQQYTYREERVAKVSSYCEIEICNRHYNDTLFLFAPLSTLIQPHPVSFVPTLDPTPTRILCPYPCPYPILSFPCFFLYPFPLPL